MTREPYVLAEKPEMFHQTSERNLVWSLGDPCLGVEVTDERDLDELTVSFCAVLSRHVSDDEPTPVFTVCRVGATLSENDDEVFLHVTYERWRSRFKMTMNAGADRPELVGVTLEDAPPELVLGRPLAFYVEVSAGRIFASVMDPHGDFALDAVALSTGGPGQPWGAPAAGNWRVTSGTSAAGYEPSTPPAPGCGLSNLRITLGSHQDAALGSTAYQGALDHLSTHDREAVIRFEPEEFDFTKDTPVIVDKLDELADELHEMSRSVTLWAPKLGAMARDLRRLAFRLAVNLRLQASGESER